MKFNMSQACRAQMAINAIIRKRGVLKVPCCQLTTCSTSGNLANPCEKVNTAKNKYEKSISRFFSVQKIIKIIWFFFKMAFNYHQDNIQFDPVVRTGQATSIINWKTNWKYRQLTYPEKWSQDVQEQKEYHEVDTKVLRFRFCQNKIKDVQHGK